MTTMRSTTATGLLVRVAIVGLTVVTGWIHLRLGGTLLVLNGLGYLVAAVAMVVPIPFVARLRWFVRLGLIGYATATIVGWYLIGPRFDLAYISKAAEVALIGLLLVEIRAYDGNPLQRVRRAMRPLARA